MKLIKDDKKYYIFLDEIQHVRQFEKALSSLKATKNVSIFVTGSNSKLLSGRLALMLVGRCKEFKIMPFSYSEFTEFCEINNKNVTDPLQNYLRFGGMPQRMDYDSETDIREYLADLLYGIVNKDICGPKSNINKTNFQLISKYIIANAGKEFSATGIANYFSTQNDDKMFRMTVYRYLEKMEQACLVSRVSRYNVASKRTLKATEKQYAVDNGIILGCSSTNQLFPSRQLENVVYNELKSRGYEVFAGKTYKGEIDFVAMKDGRKCFIQVAYLISDQNVAEREFGAFKPVKDPSPKYVLSLDKFDMSKDGITHINVEKWLLGEVDLFLS